MIPVEEAREIIRSKVEPLGSMEIDLRHAAGRVLAREITADAFYPAGDRAMMDGYVIGADESPGTFRVTGEIPAGVAPDRHLSPGEAMRVFTGALLPQGGGRVVMQEDVSRAGDQVTIPAFVENRFIRPRGSEAVPGAVVLPAGIRLDAAEIAILAQVGAVRPHVFRQPLIRHLATGDELVAPDEQPGPGQIRDTNSSLLSVLTSGHVASHRVADDPAAIARVAAGTADDWDLLLVSGGAGAGDYDFGTSTLLDLGFEIHFGRVNLRPGKPLAFATRGRQVAFIIPGNPVSHFVCYHLAIRLAIELLSGEKPRWDFITAELAGDVIPRQDPRDSFHPARLHIEGGKMKVALKRWSTSGDTFSLAGTNALARVNASSPREGLIDVLPCHPPF